MKQALYLYQAAPSRGEMLLANDSSSFTLPYFEQAQEILAKVHSFPLSDGVSFYPNNAFEDPVMALSRTSFRLSEWLLPALIVDENDEPSTALLINRSHHENALVVSLKNNEVLVRCLNGVEIREEEGEAMSGKEFLSTLSLNVNPTSFAPTKQSMPADLGYFFPDQERQEVEDEGPIHIEISRPAFEPSSKKATLDLGSSFLASEPSEEEESDEAIHIEVAKESFSASSSKKPRDLGSFSKDRKKKPSVSTPLEEEEPSQEAIASSFIRPSFEPNVQAKAPTPQAPFEKPATPNQKKYGSKSERKPSEPASEKKTLEPSFVSPSFEPSSNKKPDVLTKKTRNQRPYQEKVEDAPKKETEISPALSPKEEQVYVFCRRKDAPASSTIFNDPLLMFVTGKFSREGKKRFSKGEKTIDSSKTSFVSMSDEEKPALLAKALSPNLEAWDFLAMNVDNSYMPYAFLLSNKEDPLLCAIYEEDEKGNLSLACLCHNGVSIEDPALDYEALRALCFPKK